MTRLLTLCCAFALTISPALAQQEMTLSRHGDSVTLALPDGATETIIVDDDEVIRIVVRDGEVVVSRGGVHPRVRALAFAPPAMETFDDVELELESVLDRLPDIVRERIGGVALPRVRVERDVPEPLRRDIADAERETRRLALELRQAEREGRTGDVERLRNELDRSLVEAFDLHQEARNTRLEAIRARQRQLQSDAADLAAEVEEREQRRSEIIERRRHELTRERGSLDW